MKNAGKACNNRLYRHIRTFEKIVKNYFVILEKTHKRKTEKNLTCLQVKYILKTDLSKKGIRISRRRSFTRTCAVMYRRYMIKAKILSVSYKKRSGGTK